MSKTSIDIKGVEYKIGDWVKHVRYVSGVVPRDLTLNNNYQIIEFKTNDSGQPVFVVIDDNNTKHLYYYDFFSEPVNIEPDDQYEDWEDINEIVFTFSEYKKL